MARIKQQALQQATRKQSWYSPGILVAAVYMLILSGIGVSLATWWAWVTAVIVSIVIDALLGVQQHRVIRVKRTTEYGGVQDDDDGVV